MRIKRYLFGFMGLLSLIGFIGIFTEERIFLAFFAFVVHFEYFFIKSDEMLEEYMSKSSSRAFYCGMITVALATLLGFFMISNNGSEALLLGFAAGWTVSVLVYGSSVAYYSIIEGRGLENDRE